jgi:xylulokinase
MAHKRFLAGIDVGTSGVKAVLIDEAGGLAAEATEPYPLYSPEPSWYEQDPQDWWDGTVRTLCRVLAESGVDPSHVAGIGLSGQYHGLVVLDAQRNVLRRSILWNDQRTARQSDDIVERVGKETLLRVCATRGAPYFTACKLQWVRDHEPRVYEKIDKLMLPKDYVRFRLTGELATDETDASGTLFLDIPHRRWSREVIDRLGVDGHILPDVVESTAVSGQVSESAAQATGLKKGTPVAGGAGDQAAAAIGLGIVEEGTAAYSIGTSGVIYVSTDDVRIDEAGRVNTFCHAVPGKWCLLACVNAATASYQWFIDSFADQERGEASRGSRNIYQILEEQAGQAPPGSDGLLFLPYLSGERHPHTDTRARGVFFGLHTGHRKPHFLRAVMEGVAYSFRDCLEVVRENGVRVSQIRATGGGAHSPLWMSIQTSVSSEPILLMDSRSGGAPFGAAILGGVGAGMFTDVKEACARLVRTGERLAPDPVKASLYGRYFELFRTMYPTLKDTYAQLAEITAGGHRAGETHLKRGKEGTS